MPWWPSARREALIMADMVSAMYADIGAPLATTMFAIDAMGASELDHGRYGVVACDFPLDVVKETFHDSLEPGFTVVKLDGSFRGSRCPERRIGSNVPFTKIQKEVLQADWRPLLWGRWAASDHITLGRVGLSSDSWISWLRR